MLIYGRRAVLEALGNKKRRFESLHLAEGLSPDKFAELKNLALRRNIQVVVQKRNLIEKMVPGTTHQGVVAKVRASVHPSLDDVLQDLESRKENPFLLVLDEIQDPRNLGALVRTAAAAGVFAVVLGRHRTAPVGEAAQKSAAGAMEIVPLVIVANLAQALDRIKKSMWVVGTDMGAGTDYTKADLSGPLALVMGGEGKGLRPLTLKKCDQIVHIPANPNFGVLNVSVATGIMLFEALRQRRAKKD